MTVTMWSPVGIGRSDRMADEWLLWQLVDSAFPSGAFAHSGGLEAAWQQGHVNGGRSLAPFVDAALVQSARGALPFALAARADPKRFDALDALCDAGLTNHVANRASRAQGQSLLAGAERIFGVPLLTEVQAAARSSATPTHFAPVFGVVTGALGIDRLRTSQLFIFWTLRGVISSAVRLGVVGPMEGQTIQARAAGRAAQLAADFLDLPAEDAAQTAPILDLLQGAQDRLYSRLFQS